MKGVIVCVLVQLCRVVYGSLAEEVANTTLVCCNQGTSYGRQHSSEDCSSSAPPPVPTQFGTICVYAMDTCCKEYFQKKRDCDTGIDIATSTQRCDGTINSAQACCNECLKGTEMAKRGAAACEGRGEGSSAEELLAGDAFKQCCVRSVDHNEKRYEAPLTQESPASKAPAESEVSSLCEEYAPNELCAHHCIPVPGSYKCECNPGYKLMADRRNCKKVEQNRCKPRNPCHHICSDNGGANVKCSCRRGYELMADKKSCQDIDECTQDPPICLAGTKCFNVHGSYKCIPLKPHNTPSVEKGQCPVGFSRNLVNYACDDINECLLPQPPCPPHLCENTIGGYKCGGVSGDPANLATRPRPQPEDRCPVGFRAGRDEECEDVDECAIRKDDCNQQSQFCINTRGSFYCQDRASKYCPPGFKINEITSKCEDINECEDDPEICRDLECINLLGQYDCQRKRAKTSDCPDGMRWNKRKGICEDIDECAEGTHLCDQYQNCLNTNGSHECHCKIGFKLDPTTGACVDVNECATDRHNCVPRAQRCDNTVGSFLCVRMASCGTGYTLQHTTGLCEDIDECALNIDDCADHGPQFRCNNIPGSFRCERIRPPTTSTTPLPEYEYVYYDSDGEEINETQPIPPANSNQLTSTTSTTPRPEPTLAPPSTTPTPPPTPPPKRPEDNEIFFRPSEPEPSKPTPSTYYETSQEPERPKEIESARESERPRDPERPREPEAPTETDHRREPVRPIESEKPREAERPTEPQRPIDPVQPREPERPQEPERPTESPRNTERPIDADRPREPQPETTKEQEPQEPRRPTYNEPGEAPEPQRPVFNDPRWAVTPYNRPTEPPRRDPSENAIIPEVTYRPEATSPRIVYVNRVDEETATVEAEKRRDGSVFIDTKNVPPNEWTKVNERPVDCQIGFEMDSYGACFDIDECATSRHSCSRTETCRNTMGAYVCDCSIGYRRELATGECTLIITTPPPTTKTTAATVPSGFYDPFWGVKARHTTSRPFRHRNLCDAGYHLNSTTDRCEDVNECLNGQASCADVELCINTKGGYRCECPPNWSLDPVRHRCVPVRNANLFPPGYGNEPEYPPVDQGQPENTGTKFVEPTVTDVGNRRTMSCKWGYRLGRDNICEDINECLTGEAKCGPQQLCNNLPGGYTCSCPRGHRLAGDHQCEDVDECDLAGNQPICSQNADCVNTIGSYQCRCHEGFRSAPANDKVCVDVDECSESPSGSLCEQRCNNVWGGHRCSCHRGYRLKADNRTCGDVDECNEFKSKVLCIGRCVNEPGSYRCSCPTGYRLSEDKRSCIDIDECETGEAECASAGTFGGVSDVCLNTRGSYRCVRIECPPGYRLESRHRCTKIEKVCSPSDWQCSHQPSTYSYNFITFVSKLYIPIVERKVDLFTMRGPSWPNAKERFELSFKNVNAPPSVKVKADIKSFLLTQTGNQAMVSLVQSLEGPQSIELELSMELYSGDTFGGIAVAKLFIYVTEYEF